MKKTINLEVVTIRGWKKIVNLEVVTTRGWKKIVNLEVVTTRGWKKIVNLEVVTIRGWKTIVNLVVEGLTLEMCPDLAKLFLGCDKISSKLSGTCTRTCLSGFWTKRLGFRPSTTKNLNPLKRH